MPSKAIVICKVGEGKKLEAMARGLGFAKDETVIVETNAPGGDDVPKELQDKVNAAFDGLNQGLSTIKDGEKFMFWYSGPQLPE